LPIPTFKAAGDLPIGNPIVWTIAGSDSGGGSGIQAIALGHNFPAAVISAKTFLNQCLKSLANIGAGHGPMLLRPFENEEEDRPTLH
jgi:hydroxymethylpyrimidine/phosphomethylpyrimidine kinase